MAALPPPPTNDATGSYAWLEWFRQLRTYISTVGSVPWNIIDFAGSTLSSIASRSHQVLQALQGGTTGEYYHLTSTQHTDLTDGGGSTLHSHAHNNMTSPQGGTTNEYFHLTQTTFDDVVAYLKGGTTGAGWNDLIGDPIVRAIGANDPTWAVYRGNLRQYSFSNALMNEIWVTYHIEHDYKPASDIYLHVHWSQNVVDTGGTAGAPGDVKWYADVSYAKGHNQAAFIAPITTSITATASATQYQHLISEVQLSATSPSGSQLDSDNLEPDGVLLVRLYRDPADVADTLNQVPFVHFIDIHYQTDRINTKNKAPNFYA